MKQFVNNWANHLGLNNLFCRLRILFGYLSKSLAILCSSLDLILERICLEGSRRQAKYAVHALAAITKDEGLKSLSVLYKVLTEYIMHQMILNAS